MSRVLHIITGLSAGGAERALYNLLSGGLAKRFACAVISLRDEGVFGPRLTEHGVPVYPLGMRSSIPGPKSILRLRKYVKSFSPDVIQGWMYHGNLASSLGCMFAPGRPMVAWNVRHSLYNLVQEKSMTRQVIRANRTLSGRADAIIYNSRISREQHEQFGFNGMRGKVIPNGFDLELLKPEPSVGMDVRREFSIPDNVPVIGHVARFHSMKNHASFLRAAVQLAKTHSTVRFLVVGREVSPQNPALAGVVPFDLLDRFVFPGERPDVHRLMQAMDVLAMSSAWGEGFPNVIGEAMACGVPCVTTDVGDSADIVWDTGIVVPPLDDNAMLRGLTAMLEKPAKERKSLGKAARERVANNYGLDSVVAQYSELYDKLVNRV